MRSELSKACHTLITPEMPEQPFLIYRQRKLSIHMNKGVQQASGCSDTGIRTRFLGDMHNISFA